MKPSDLILAVTLAAFASVASAQMAVEDADGSGGYSMEEMAMAYPDLTADDFAEIDADASGELSDDEIAAAVDSGMLAAE